MRLATWIHEGRRLLESEVWVDENGYAHDDEGNIWFVGKHKAGSFGKASQFGGGGGGSNYPWTTAQMAARADFLDDVLTLQPNNFLASIRRQVLRLSDKQKTAAADALQKMLAPPWDRFFLGTALYQKGSVELKKAVKKEAQGDVVGVLRQAIKKKDDPFLAMVLQSAEADPGWKKGAADEALKKIRHELYKRGMKKEADLFR